MNNTWEPIKSLRYDNADTSVFFLSQGIMAYPIAVNDPWFNATLYVDQGGSGGLF